MRLTGHGRLQPTARSAYGRTSQVEPEWSPAPDMGDSSRAPEPRSEMANRSGYLPVSEHGLIGDLHTVALVGTNGTIDWHCSPSFDAPSVFGSILDADDGGCFELAAALPAKTPQVHIPDTNALVTRSVPEQAIVRVHELN